MIDFGVYLFQKKGNAIWFRLGHLWGFHIRGAKSWRYFSERYGYIKWHYIGPIKITFFIDRDNEPFTPEEAKEQGI